MISAVRMLGLAAMLAPVAGTIAFAQDSKARQSTQTPGQAGPSAAAAAPSSKAASAPSDVLATVNGEPITKPEVISWLARFEITPGSEQRAYEAALDNLVDGKLVEQFLRKNNVPVTKADVDRYVEEVSQQLKQAGSSIENELAMTATTPDEFRKKATVYAQRP
jgi:hypothetical protein